MIREITSMINEEVEIDGEVSRKSLLGMMADIRGSTAISVADIRGYLITGDENYEKSFNKNWTKNELRYNELLAVAHPLTQTQRASLESYGALRAEFVELAATLFEIRGSQQWNMANYILLNEAVPHANALLLILTGNHNQITNQFGGLVGQQSKNLVGRSAFVARSTSNLSWFCGLS